MTTSAPELTFELIVATFESDGVPCESCTKACEQRGAHPADWYARAPLCGVVIALCEERRKLAEKDKGWFCKRTHTEPYDRIQWTPIEKT